MMKKRVIIVANVSLVIIAVLLTLNLFNVSLPSFGRVLNSLNSEQPLCQIQWEKERSNLPDLDLCCLEARKQLHCSLDQKEWICQTGSGEVLQYVLNEKAYYYCQQQVIWGQ